jgi:hypothetical protein
MLQREKVVSSKPFLQNLKLTVWLQQRHRLKNLPWEADTMELAQDTVQ